MNRTRRRRYMAAKKWSSVEKWLGAMITGPAAGTCAVSAQVVR
jgi:hypothetical protein